MSKLRKYIRLRVEIDIPLDELAISSLYSTKSTKDLLRAKIETKSELPIRILNACVKHAKIGGDDAS